MSYNLIKQGRKIVAVGKNYALHVKELSPGEALPKSPVLFLKPTTSYVFEGSPIKLPVGIGPVHHEIELAYVIGSLARKVPPQRALDHVAAYALAIDLTARDLQSAAKKTGFPWSVSKGYDGFCPISQEIPKSKIVDPDNVEIYLNVNGKQRQRGNTKGMIFNTSTIISYISHIFTLEPGDVVLSEKWLVLVDVVCSGTPEGVGPLVHGDKVEAGIEGVMSMRFTVEDDK